MSYYSDLCVDIGQKEQKYDANSSWEDVLTQWAKNADPHTLSQWLIIIIRPISPLSAIPLLDKMQRWYSNQDEKLRWEIFHHAESIGFDTPAGALALSLFWSQGSMSPEGLEPVYPEPHLSTEMRRSVLMMLATYNSDYPADGAYNLLARWKQDQA